jgi:hypothetical protein
VVSQVRVLLRPAVTLCCIGNRRGGNAGSVQVVAVQMTDIESCCESTAIQRAVAAADCGAPLHMMPHAWFQLQPI